MSLSIFALTYLLLSASSGSSLLPFGLTCEYRESPSGIDTVHPRLSWKLNARTPRVRDLRQTAYEIQVSSSPEKLRTGKPDLWDSGTVASSATTLIPYEGRPLLTDQACFWRVRTKDQAGQWSGWSSSAQWTMGVMPGDEWSGTWIGGAASGNDPWLRTTLDIPAIPSRAPFHVASLGYHELYVNGRRVGDAVLEPAVSDLKHRALYASYDLTPYLHRGKNVIGLWLGAGWSTYHDYQVEGRPQLSMVSAQGKLEWPGKPAQVFRTNEEWLTHPSPNKLTGKWDYYSFGGEEYDASKEDPEWCRRAEAGLGWTPVTVYQPGVLVSAETVEPNRVEHTLKPEIVTVLPNGEYRVDFGRNFVGWAQVRLHGKPGQTVEFLFSERPDQEVTFGLRSRYIIGPSGTGVFCNRFNYMSGRWMTIKGLDYAPKPNDIVGLQIRSGYHPASDFTCSNPLLKSIYDTTLWTFENLSLGGYVVDCPQRERRGYGGDAHATTQTALDTFSLGAFYTKWARDWRDVQAPDGDLPYTAPTYSGGGGPPWQGFIAHLPWKVYQQYGDKELLRDSLPAVKRWLDFMENHAKDGLLQRWGGQWDFLGDWLWPYDKDSGVPNGDKPQTLFLNNCYWAYALRTTAKIEHALGDGVAEVAYTDRANRLCAAIHARWYRPEAHDYANGRQQYLAAALLAGVPPTDIRPQVWQRLHDEIFIHRQGHIDAGITGGALLTRLLIDENHVDWMYEMATKEDYPSWGKFLKDGLTVLPESWDETKSLLHSSYVYVGAWFMEGLMGIRPGEQGGFHHFELHPLLAVSERLNSAEASYEAMEGRIVCGWSRFLDQVDLHVVIPPNTSADLYLPFDALESVKEDGTPVKSTPKGKGQPHLKLASGEYRLTLTFKRPS